MSTPAAAWYADPYDATRVRWWNGAAWTTAVRPRPLGTADSPDLAAPAPAPTPSVTPSVDPASAPAVTAAVAAPAAPVVTPPVDTSNLAPLPSTGPVGDSVGSSGLGAPSIGASRLPPLVAPSPAPVAEPPAPLPSARREGGVRPLFLVAGLLACVLLIGLIAYGAGVIGGGSSASGVSTPGSTTIEGDGYSFAVPDDWDETSVPDALPRAVSTVVDGPDDLVAFVMRTDQSAVMPDDPDVQARFLDLMVQTEQSALSQAQVLGSVPTTLGGAPAQLVTMQGVDASGATEQAYVVAAVHDGRLYMLFLGGPGESASAAKDEFDQMAASFRFD